jgi:hypothetical protein
MTVKRNKKKRNKKKRKNKPSRPQTNLRHLGADRNPVLQHSDVGDKRGFDFGIPVKAMLVGTSEFHNHLHDAGALALAYGYASCELIGHSIPILSLVVKNASPILTAFKEFERWGSNTDGDVVDIGLVIESEAKYTLTITREVRRFVDQMTRFDRALMPMSISATWMFPMPISGPHVRQFCEWRRGPARPFLFSAATVPSGLDVKKAGPNTIQPIPGLRSILKFHCEIVEPGVPTKSPLGEIVSRFSKGGMSGKKRPAMSSGFPDKANSPAEIHIHRDRILRTYFPVTMERLALFRLPADIEVLLAENALANWQIQQAICNISLSKKISNGDLHYKNLASGDEFARNVAEALG